MATSEVALSTVTLPAAVVPKVTVDVAVKAVPVMVTGVPPDDAPVAGLMDVTVGTPAGVRAELPCGSVRVTEPKAPLVVLATRGVVVTVSVLLAFCQLYSV